MPIDDQITEQRPYRGMQKFSEEHKNLFFGRTKPIDEIFDLLRNNILTVIFGKSGIGKSSLLNAGLLPKLRENFYLPVLIRIPFSDPGIDPLAYTQSAIEAEIKKYIYKDFKYPENTTLWQFFREANYTGGAVIPVLIFDQFEEYFNFGKEYKQRAEKFIKELSDLIENRVPAQLKNIDTYKTLSASDTQNTFRVMISLREDFLAPLEDLGKLVPSLGKIRYRILPLRGKEAFDAVYLPAKNLIDEATVIHLLKKIIPKKIKAEADKIQTVGTDDSDWEQKDFEPYILSLFCYQVNEKRIAIHQPKISEELIDQTKVETILSDYYESSLKKYRHRYHKDIGSVLETSLISKEGYRLLKPANSTEFESIPEQAIKDMVDDRIIQIVNRNEINNIEISHDLLANVVYQKKAVDRRNKKFAIFIGSCIALFLILAFIIFKQTQDNSTVQKQIKAVQQKYNIAKDSLVKKDSLNDSLAERYTKTILAINQQYSGTVYFQVNSNIKTPQLLNCMQELRDMKFVVPSFEVITDKQFKNMIKYFHPEDKATAEKIQAVCNKFYTEQLSIQPINLNSNKVSPGTIEVWLNYEHHYDQLFNSTPSVSNNAKEYLITAYKSIDLKKTWPKKMVATARAYPSDEDGVYNTLYVFSKMDADYLRNDKDLITSWLRELQKENNPRFTDLINEINKKLGSE